MKPYQHFIKPLCDRIAALIILLIFSPIIIVVYLFLKNYKDGNAFFVQYRLGLHGKPFKIFKFRTMEDVADSTGEMLSDQQRITPAGRIIRAWSLDELPQLFNVLMGDMSLVGPRPLLVKYLPLYNEKQARRHDVMPGITGWAQINGRNTISWEQKFQFDILYVKRQNMLLDLHILWITVINVLKRKGISAENHATMGEFKGSNQLPKQEISISPELNIL